MTLKTYYGKLDCNFSVPTALNLSNEIYKSFCDFMSYMSASSTVELVAWNSGANARSGSFAARTYWDGNLPFGGNAFSLWRFNATPERNFDWYLYAQVLSGGFFSYNLREPFNTPISGYANSIDYASNAQTWNGILMQAAVCFSGSTSFNPWNGDLGNGNANASLGAGNGFQRWVSGANDRILYVLPRSNDSGGATSTRKDNCILNPRVMASTTKCRISFISDGDSLLTAVDFDGSKVYSPIYIGPFELRNSLSSSGIAGTGHGFMMNSRINNSSLTITTNTIFGGTAGTVPDDNGGVAVPVLNIISGSKNGILNIIENFNAAVYQPNFLTKRYDEFPFLVGINENPHYGLVGQMNSGLLRLTRQVLGEDVSSDFSRAIIKGDATIGNESVSIPWTGSMAPGTSFSRTGSQYTWVKDYG
jgi:hypothetical protein